MSHILAIESDRKRRTLLMGLIREHVLADVTMVDSVKEAVASFERQQPDLIIAPALLSPEDSERLHSHVKWHADPHVQMVTLPALDMLRESAPEERPRFALFGWRRPVTLGLQYDPSMVARQIADRLDCALTLRAESARDLRPLLRKPEAMVVVKPTQETASRPAAAAVVAALRERAERMPATLWAVRMPWGNEVEMVNISRTGVLLESGSKVSPGVTLELQLTGMGQSHIVLARFVRSEISRVDRLGVRYHAAAQFEQPLDILTSRTEQQAPMATPRSLAELFSTVVSDSNQPEDSSIRFARGLRALVGARDVFIRSTPVAPGHDCESIYFRVNGDDRSGMILQILLDRDRSLSTGEFRLMKAASGLASALLELQHTPMDNGRLLTAPMAQVA